MFPAWFLKTSGRSDPADTFTKKNALFGGTNSRQMNHDLSGDAKIQVTAGHGEDATAFSDGEDRLLRIAILAEKLNIQQVARDARSGAERIAEGRFYVACVGQFKRGKSTLLNALVGERILPSAVIPVTAVPTVLRFGERREARVRIREGEWAGIDLADVEDYVTEARNPENGKGVTALEVFIPSPLLYAGMCLVDTPGLGSVFAGNAAATQEFVPQIDAAIAVIGADPPIGGDELSLVESVAQNVPDILFVLNKADRVTAHERKAAVEFAREVLEKRIHRPVPTIFEVSALERLNGNGCSRDWPQLMESLEKLTRRSGKQLVHDAAGRLVRRFSDRLLGVVGEERNAFTRPFEDSEKRIVQLREVGSQAERSLIDLGFLLSGEQQRLSKMFADRREGFLKSIRATAQAELDTLIKRLPRIRGPRYRRSVMEAAQSVARRFTLPWLDVEQKNAENAYREITQRFTHLANDFLAKARNLEHAETGHLPTELEATQAFRARSGFRFYEYVNLAHPTSPLRYLTDLALSMVFGHSLIAIAAYEFLDRLLETNSERVRNDLENRVMESRRGLEAEIRAMLGELIAVAEGALAHARTAHAAGAATVEMSMARLATVEDELLRLRDSADPGNA